MKKLAALTLLTGCTFVRGNMPQDEMRRCSPEVEQVKQECVGGVIGETPELNAAIDELRECFGIDARIVCSDPGLFEPNVLTINKL